MSRFYLTASNSRGNTTSAAGSSRGQDAHLRGWSAGVEVVASVGDDGDEFRIYMTHGSNGGGNRELVGIVREKDHRTGDGPTFQVLA
jgi:hypothetical protein